MPPSSVEPRIVAVDLREHARTEAGDLLSGVREGALTWERVVELSALVFRPPSLAADAVTVLSHQGIALGDIAIAALVYRKAVAGTAATR